MKKKQDFSTFSHSDLVQELTTAREKLRQHTFNQSINKIKNVNEGSMLKKNIARIMTAMNKKKNA